MSFEVPFTKKNLDLYLRELGKEYRRRGKGVHAELILIGGASVLINYGFREMTYDIDAISMPPTVMKEAVNAVGDRFGLPNGWLNMDFMRTSSYTPRLAEYAVHYKTFSHVLEVRTIRAEYLLAMKLVSGRRYKKDMSDIVGILIGQARAGQPLSYEKIDKAVIDLYDDWSRINNDTRTLLLKALETPNLEELFSEQCAEEARSKEVIAEIVQKSPGVVRENNIQEIIAAALEKKK
ncbi:MAG: hypothetical protein LIO67_05250 [Lachnospiraceae bacterium]|nr:hypothetical protein [Lachnospiraceae bacterium]